jgi:hypothetical protein
MALQQMYTIKKIKGLDYSGFSNNTFLDKRSFPDF